MVRRKRYSCNIHCVSMQSF